jgi:hypothetical protein
MLLASTMMSPRRLIGTGSVSIECAPGQKIRAPAGVAGNSWRG